jgi:hypothetical protein
MLMSSPRRRQSRIRQKHVGGERQQADRAHDLDGGREPVGDLHGHLHEHPDPECGHDRALEQRGAGLPEQAAADDVQAEAYTMASPSMSTESANNAVELPRTPATLSTRNIATLIQSTTCSTRRCSCGISRTSQHSSTLSAYASVAPSSTQSAVR